MTKVMGNLFLGILRVLASQKMVFLFNKVHLI